jgi:uncharacterized protein YhbP (UPF0306 family)
LSEPRARHSRNIRANDAVAVAVYDSHQTWGRPDRGIQLFGAAEELARSASAGAEELYALRFQAYREGSLDEYRFYVFRPRRMKLFDEREFGAGVFVTARVLRAGRLAWVGTVLYDGR